MAGKGFNKQFAGSSTDLCTTIANIIDSDPGWHYAYGFAPLSLYSL